MSFDRKLRFNVVVKIIIKVISICEVDLRFSLLIRFVHYNKRNRLALVLVFELAS